MRKNLIGNLILYSLITFVKQAGSGSESEIKPKAGSGSEKKIISDPQHCLKGLSHERGWAKASEVFGASPLKRDLLIFTLNRHLSLFQYGINIKKTRYVHVPVPVQI